MRSGIHGCGARASWLGCQKIAVLSRRHDVKLCVRSCWVYSALLDASFLCVSSDLRLAVPTCLASRSRATEFRALDAATGLNLNHHLSYAFSYEIAVVISVTL